MRSPSYSFDTLDICVKRQLLFIALAILILLPWISPDASGQQRYAEVTGLVTDMLNGQPLQGASVFLTQPGVPGILAGTATSRDGRYTLERVLPGRYRMIVRFVGYEEESISIVLNPDQRLIQDASLAQSSIDLNTIVVSASRQEEKVLDAITSISVLSDHEVQRETSTSPASSLRLIPGVDYAQTGIDRREISIRGFNNSITGETYVLTDNRLSAVPGLAVNAYGLMPIPTLDISRIEIVRGPGSALYGSGVDQGLIHFITKNPFSYQGTSISTGGGERGVLETEFRHAGVYNDNLGYKIVGEYSEGEDWELSQTNPEDLNTIAVDGDTRDTDYWKYGINGWLEYHFDKRTRLIANGGYLSQKMALLTGIGAAQTDNFSYAYGQIQLHAGSFYSQIYVNQNNGGNSFYYSPTTSPGARFDIVDRTLLFNGQVQYNMNLFEGREDVLIGSDYKLTIPKTEGSIHGRNESRDRIEEIGLYVQSTTKLTDDVNLTLATRGDYNNLAENLQFSPRAGIVFKITPQHTFSVAANLAYSAPVLNPNFLDLRISNEAIANPFMLATQGRGAYDGFTFDQFRENGTVTYLIPDIGDLSQPDSPALFGQSIPLDQLPVHPVYEAFASELSNALLTGQSLPAPLDRLSATDRELFAQLINQLLPFVRGNTQGVLGIPALNEQGYREISGPTDIDPLKQTQTSSIEVGYKGTIGNQLVISADVYITQKKNFIGPLSLESPYVFMANLEDDLAALMRPSLNDFASADPNLAALLQSLDMDASEASAFLAGLAANGHDNLLAYSQTRVGVVQPDQQILPDGEGSNIAGSLYTYRNFGNVRLWGTDIAVDYTPSERLRVQATMSYISDGTFDNTELQEEDSDLSVALNAPTFKVGASAEYQFPFGLSLYASGRAVNDFTVISGPYMGQVEDYMVFDAGVGYDFGRQISGLRVDMTAQNLLTFVNGKSVSTHREFIGSPEIGRIIMARILFTF